MTNKEHEDNWDNWDDFETTHTDGIHPINNKEDDVDEFDF